MYREAFWERWGVEEMGDGIGVIKKGVSGSFGR